MSMSSTNLNREFILTVRCQQSLSEHLQLAHCFFLSLLTHNSNFTLATESKIQGFKRLTSTLTHETTI